MYLCIMSQSIEDGAEEYHTELDNHWITEFQKLETEYNDFYKETPQTAKLYFLYLNPENTIVSITKDTAVLDKYGTIKKEKVIDLINKNKTHNNKKMALEIILKYNFTVEPGDVLDILANRLDGGDFLAEMNSLNDIRFKDTVHFFCETNALYFIYKERCATKHATTKKIYLKPKHIKQRTRCKRT